VVPWRWEVGHNVASGFRALPNKVDIKKPSCDDTDFIPQNRLCRDCDTQCFKSLENEASDPTPESSGNHEEVDLAIIGASARKEVAHKAIQNTIMPLRLRILRSRPKRVLISLEMKAKANI